MGFFIAVIRPSLNEHLDLDSLITFKNGATWTYVLIRYGNNHSEIIVIATNINEFINL